MKEVVIPLLVKKQIEKLFVQSLKKDFKLPKSVSFLWQVA